VTRTRSLAAALLCVAVCGVASGCGGSAQRSAERACEDSALSLVGGSSVATPSSISLTKDDDTTWSGGGALAVTSSTSGSVYTQRYSCTVRSVDGELVAGISGINPRP